MILSCSVKSSANESEAMEEETEKSSDKTRVDDSFELKITKTKDGTEKYVFLMIHPPTSQFTTTRDNTDTF